MKLLGAKIDEELNFNSLISLRRSAGFNALWKLRRLASRGVNQKHLLMCYKSYVRSALEYSLVSCFPCLSNDQFARLESVQRRATRVIMGMQPLRKSGDGTLQYEERCERLGLQSIQERTRDRFHKFLEKAEFEPRLARFFIEREPDPSQRSIRKRHPYKIHKWSKIKSYTAPITTLIKHANKLQSTRAERLEKYLKDKSKIVTRSMAKSESQCFSVIHTYES